MKLKMYAWPTLVLTVAVCLKVIPVYSQESRDKAICGVIAKGEGFQVSAQRGKNGQLKDHVFLPSDPPSASQGNRARQNACSRTACWIFNNCTYARAKADELLAIIATSSDVTRCKNILRRYPKLEEDDCKPIAPNAAAQSIGVAPGSIHPRQDPPQIPVAR